MNYQQALAFVEALVGFNRLSGGGVEESSHDALVHLQAALGQGEIPHEVDVSDIHESIRCGYLFGSMGNNSASALKRIHNLADFFTEVGSVLREAIAEPALWVKQEEEERQRREAEAKK
jgi:hypothetical protein